MLGSNSNKLVWVGIALGIVGSIGATTMVLFPSAMDEATTVVTHAAYQFVDPDQGFGDTNPKTDDYQYNDDGTAYLTNYHQDSKAVVVPSTLRYNGKEYTVTRINDGALQNKGIISLEIPDTVKTIGNSAVMSNKLTSVTLPAHLVTVEANAFADNKLTIVKFDDDFTTIGDWAFKDNALPSISLNEGLKSIGSGAFQGNQFDTVSLPDSLSDIGDWAFAGAADGSGVYVKTITHTPEIVSPTGANYNPNAFNGDVVWTKP